MACVKSWLSILLVLLVLPVVAGGAFMHDCGCGRMTHKVITYCNHCEHEHEAPAESGCLHEEYLLQSVNTQVNVPVCPVVETTEELPLTFLSEARSTAAHVAERLEHWHRWGPPDGIVLPLLI